MAWNKQAARARASQRRASIRTAFMGAWSAVGACGVVLSIAVPVTKAPAQVQPKPAFPGAEGHGRMAKGGRGGAIIPVTNLADSGRGSLRACIDAVGPRTCVFRVGGIIRWTTTRPIIRNPYITIAGQTAPGGGILITHAGGPFGLTPLVIKDTHDVVVRHIRVRLDRRGDTRASDSGIIIEDSANVIVDHASVSWAEDESIGGQGQNDNITISNSVMAEGLRRHDKCALLSSDPRGPQKLSFVRNLCAHNGDRNPDVNFFPGSCVDVVNNLIYNARSDFVEVWEQHGGSPVNIVGNYFKAGPNMLPGRFIVARQSVAATGPARIYLAGNHAEGAIEANPPPLVQAVLVAAPSCPLVSRATTAAQAFDNVLAGAGAFPRDAVDQRVVQEVRAGTGQIRRTPGILPMIARGNAYPDADLDGMDDGWERAHGLNPAANDAWGDRDGDGWSNFDAFLEHRHREVLANRSDSALRRPTVLAPVIALAGMGAIAAGAYALRAARSRGRTNPTGAVVRAAAPGEGA